MAVASAGMTKTSDIAGLAALGLCAGLIGTLAMTASQKAEIALTGRKPSRTPAQAVETLSGTKPQTDGGEQQLSSAAHLAFGTTLGLGLAALAEVPEPGRGALFLAGAWATGTAITTELGLADPPTRRDARELATDLGHHVVYAVTAALAFAGLRRLARI
jgi:hypothetical protein